MDPQRKHALFCEQTLLGFQGRRFLFTNNLFFCFINTSIYDLTKFDTIGLFNTIVTLVTTNRIFETLDSVIVN